MLEPITKNMTDNSTEESFCFTFYCDICKASWESIPVKFSQAVDDATEKHINIRSVRESDHYAAYERANHEAMQYFNRCPVCKRWVCDRCFSIMSDRDVCKECAVSENGKKKK
jgi:hypothetical protein